MKGELTEFQRRCVEVIERHSFNGSIPQSQVRRRLGVSNIAVHNALQALRRRGAADCFLDGEGRWAQRCWFLKRPRDAGVARA